VHSLYCT